MPHVRYMYMKVCLCVSLKAVLLTCVYHTLCMSLSESIYPFFIWLMTVFVCFLKEQEKKEEPEGAEEEEEEVCMSTTTHRHMLVIMID